MEHCEEIMTFEELKILRQLAMDEAKVVEEDIEDVVDVSAVHSLYCMRA